MATQAVSSSDSHHNSDGQIWTSQEVDYFSSSPLASPHRSPFSVLEEELSLGVFFSPEEGEANDVLAALRASLRVVKQTIEVVVGLRPRNEQTRELAEILRGHERGFMAWIFDGVGILPSTRMAIRTLPLFANLVAYIKLLKDLQMDLPYRSQAVSTPPPTKVNFLRRLSSAGSSQTRSRTNSLPIPPRLGSLDIQKDPRLTAIITRASNSFAALKESITIFVEGQRKLRASNDTMERTRKELGITHNLCLQGTRENIKAVIKSWANPSRSFTTESTPAPAQEPSSTTSSAVESTPSPEETEPVDPTQKQVLVLVGAPGSGKSTLLATLACEWKRTSSLGPHLFLTSPRQITAKRASSGKRLSGDEVEVEPHKNDGAGRGHSLSKKLSRISRRRGSSANMKRKAVPGDVAAFGEALAMFVMLESKERMKEVVIFVDGLDHVDAENAKRVVEIVKRSAEKDADVKLLLTIQRDDSPILEELKMAGLVDFIYLTDIAMSDKGADAGGMKTPYDPSDIRRYVAARLPVDLTSGDQYRVVEAVEGNFADAVRICRDIEDTGSPERSLDGVLYREAVRRHGEGRVKVVLI